MGTMTEAGGYNITNGMGAGFEVCYMEDIVNSTSPWQRVQPLEKALPRFLWQLGTVILLTRGLMFACKPLRLPRFFFEILSGILLGPSAFGNTGSKLFSNFEGVIVLETIGTLGLTYYMFVVGLEMDLSPILQVGTHALCLAMAGVAVPVVGGAALYHMLANTEDQAIGGYAFWTITLAVTSFPDLARILSDLKLLHTDLGKTALLVSIINDNFAGILLVIALSMFGHKKITALSTLPGICCVLFFWFAVRPMIRYVIQWRELRDETPAEERYNDGHIHFMLALVPLCGFLTELCGIHSMVGGFLLGLIIPSGELGTRIMEKVEDFVVGILLPPIFLITGIRTNFMHIFEYGDPLVVVMVVVLACLLKITAALLTSVFFRTPFRQALALGVLMNTKGVLAIIILNEGRGLQFFNQQQFAVMMFSVLLMTGCVRLVEYFNGSWRHVRGFYRRSLEKAKADSNLRILACLHSAKTVNGIVNLLRISNPTIKSPITFFAVHLVELTRGTSTMLIFHDRAKPTVADTGNNNLTREKASAENIISSFETLSRESQGIIVSPLTIVSPYDTMHEDIRDFAFDKIATLIILPFHKQSGNEAESTTDLMNYQKVIQNVLASAPCSVGILVDRGLASFSGTLMTESSDSVNQCNIAMLFFGGNDDREALAYAKRMSGSRGTKLTVVRFLLGKQAVQSILQNIPKQDEQTVADVEQQMQLDYECINEFRFKTMYNRSVTYSEKQVHDTDQVLESIRLIYDEFDLYIVGREQRLISPLTKGLSDWNEYPELGTIGELLVSSDFGSDASVLVVQQCPPPTGTSSKSLTAFVNHPKKDEYSDE